MKDMRLLLKNTDIDIDISINIVNVAQDVEIEGTII